MEEVVLKLRVETLAALRARAGAEDVTVGQIVRRAIARELARGQRPAKTPVRADERLLASLRSLLAGDFAAASGWEDLFARLATRGFDLRAAGGGTVLHRRGDGRRLCKGSELGWPHARLAERFGAAHPGLRRPPSAY